MKLKVRVQPNAKQDCLKETMADGTIKISLTAPAIDGRANQALIKFLSDHFKIPKSHIKLIRGLKSRNKIVEIYVK
ncbi:MAG: DUF167 domain-containing protein [Patescibacteria group bacterium]